MFIFVGYVKKLKSILPVQQKYSLYAVLATDSVNNFPLLDAIDSHLYCYIFAQYLQFRTSC